MGGKLPKDKDEALQKLVKSGMIDGIGPSAVQKMYEVQFGKLNTRTFGNRLLTIRKSLEKSKGDGGSSSAQVNMNDDDDDDSDSNYEPENKNVGSYVSKNNEEATYLQFLETRAKEMCLTNTSFTPIFAMAPWANPDDKRNKYLSVSIWLFSGMTKHEFSLQGEHKI